MINTRNRRAGLALAMCLMVLGIPFPAYGAKKAIPSVVIRVGTDTQAGELLNENISLYSDTTDAQDGTYAATNSGRYYVRDAEWTTSTRNKMDVGDEPRMKLYLAVEDDEYSFRGSYSSSNVTVKGGTLVTARKSSEGELEVTVKVGGIKGTYTVPSDATWKESGYGNAVWTIDDEEDDETVSSGYYDVHLYRGGNIVKRLEAYKGTSYNFYPYMTKKGTYKYRVRAVPYTEAQKKYGTKSEWLESDEIYIDEESVSDGTGQVDGNGQQTGSTGTVGWILSDGIWYYRYPDGSYEKDGWLKLKDKWYLFDRDGRMLTGWQEKGGLRYFLCDSGEMYTGWLKSDGYWYYLNRINDGVEGAAHTGWLHSNGKIYYLNQSGVMLEGWNQVENDWRYFYPGTGNMAVDTTVDTFYVDGNGIWKK